ncbi:MAG: cation:proton antiporter [Planctomycetota bacterium]
MSETAGPLLVLAGVLVAGVALGALARRFHLPAVTGQVLAGVLLGLAFGAGTAHEAAARLQPVTHFALGLIAITVGAHLDVRRLRNAGRRLGLLVLAEMTITPLIVFVGVAGPGGEPLTTAVLLAALSISTAPATVIALVKESRAKGVFVKTLIAAVALNNIACICVFELARIVSQGIEDPTASHGLGVVLLAPLKQIAGAVLVGGGAGLGLLAATTRVVRSDQLATATFIALLFTTGLADWLEVSSMLSCMVLGITLANLTPHKEEVMESAFSNMQMAALAAFFTLAGMHLDFSHLREVWPLALLIVALRALGKILSGWLAMRAARAPGSVRRNLGLALVPQAGVAVGLILLVIEDPAFEAIAASFLAVGLASVTLNEIIGPVLTRLALARSGDANKDRERLIDFLHEENIVTGLENLTKEQALARLTDVLVTSNHLRVDREALLQDFLRREREASTCLGEGLSIPHAAWPAGNRIVGAMGISSSGLGFDTPDGKPVHCVVLLLTPADQRDRHLEILGAFARVIGSDRNVRNQLYHAASPAHAYELLHTDDEDHFNYFFEDDESPAAASAS